MKNFFFSLDTVLNYKKRVLDGLKAEHMKSLVQLRKCEEEMEILEQTYQQAAKEFDHKKTLGVCTREIFVYDNFFRAIRLQIEKKQEELLHFQLEEEKRRAEVVEANKESSSLEKLKEKQISEYKMQLQKENDRIIEEFVNTKNAFTKMDV